MNVAGWIRSSSLCLFAFATLSSILVVPNAQAQQSEEFDNYKLKVDLGWFYSYPSHSHGLLQQVRRPWCPDC